MKYLVLRLWAPLMSFGEGDYWDIRGTGVFPTKSAVVGMLAACMGWPRNESDKIAGLSEGISVSVRQDNTFSILRDYHTILNTLKADGKPNENAVQSYRHYLMDAEFSVLISSRSDLLSREIKSALLDPVWPVFLGRKSCIPCAPVFWDEEIEWDDARKAFENLPLLCFARGNKFPGVRLRCKPGKKYYQCVTDERISGKKILIRDDVVNSKLRIFSQRETYKFSVEIG